MSKKLKQLTDVFRRLGADDPEGWASSQIDEGIQQLHRFLFLKAAHSHIVRRHDSRWLQALLKSGEPYPGSPDPSAAPSLQRMLDRGVDPQDITTVVRAAQYSFLFGLCQQIDDSDVIHTLPHEGELPEVGWGLFTVDEEGNPGEPIEGLHESVIEVEPL